jgi:hypothetical protein
MQHNFFFSILCKYIMFYKIDGRYSFDHVTKDLLHICYFHSKNMLFTGIRGGKLVPFHVKFNENNIFSHNLVKNLNIVTTSEFSIWYKIILWFFWFFFFFCTVQISTNYEEIIFKFIDLSIALASQCTSLFCVGVITRIVAIKTYVRIKSGMWRAR